MTQAFEPRDPGAHGDVRRYSIDATRFLSAAANRASFRFFETCCFNFETDMSVFLIFWPIHFLPANQLFLVYGDASGSICQLPRGQKPFCRGRLLHVDEDATSRERSPVLGVALGDNESLNYTLRISIQELDLTKQEKTGAMSFFTSSSKTIKRSSSRREARDSGLELVTRMPVWYVGYAYVANRPTRAPTRGLGDAGNDVLLVARPTGTRVAVPCS